MGMHKRMDGIPCETLSQKDAPDCVLPPLNGDIDLSDERTEIFACPFSQQLI
jgi:hypothetical protein